MPPPPFPAYRCVSVHHSLCRGGQLLRGGPPLSPDGGAVPRYAPRARVGPRAARHRHPHRAALPHVPLRRRVRGGLPLGPRLPQGAPAPRAWVRQCGSVSGGGGGPRAAARRPARRPQPGVHGAGAAAAPRPGACRPVRGPLPAMRAVQSGVFFSRKGTLTPRGGGPASLLQHFQFPMSMGLC